MIRKLLLSCAVLLFAAGCQDTYKTASADSSETQAAAPGPAAWEQLREDPKMQKVMFGAGCFWGVEYVFRTLDGVEEAVCGYAGGKTENPTYREICYDNTGHAEVIEVIYDPEKVTFEKLLDIFWRCHDPTQVDRQGPDIGDQYRSAIFCYTEEQEKMAKASKDVLDKSGKLERPIATEIAKAPTFYRAEEYHQLYYAKSGGVPYCHVVPK